MTATEQTVVRMDQDTGAEVWNETGGAVGTDEAMHAFRDQHSGLWAAMGQWAQDIRPKTSLAHGQNRSGGIFERDRYITPTNVYDQMRLAYQAVEDDDIVSGVADTTESLAFNRVSLYAEDPDEQDIYNQIAGDIELDARLREMWRELFTVSQFYCAVWWHNKEYKVRGKSDQGKRRKKTVSVRCPKAITLLDPLKVVPVGMPMFNQEKLAYIATREEMEEFEKPDRTDEIMNRLVVGKYEPADNEERKWVVELGIDPNRLLLLNDAIVFRHALTRPQFKRFSDIRMKSVYSLLDRKHQLEQMDRAHLIGGSLRVDQRVVTPEGWKPIGSIQVGDQVVGVDGKPNDVVGVFPQGVLDLWKVTFTDGAEVICDGNHYWTVYRRDDVSKGRPPRTITLNQIMSEGLKSVDGKLWRHRVPLVAPVELSEKDDLPLDPYLLGYMLGNGSLKGSPSITTTPGDETPCLGLLPDGVRVSQREHRPGAAPQWGLSGPGWRQNPVSEALRLLNLYGHTATDKFIPDDYLWASVEQRWSLLQGLCDADGHSHQPGGVEYSTVSSKLADGVIQLAQSLGGVAKATVVTPRPGRNEQTLYRVWVSLHQVEAPFRLVRKVASWRPRKVPYVRAIAVVERVADAEAVCIKTAREDGLFLTEGMVVTHNTNFIVVITKGSDQHPAKPEEIANLQAQVRVVARVPVLVGDHRLKVEIITPKLDQTLEPKRYNGIDARITGRLYQMFVLGNFSAGSSGDDSVKLVKVVARGMESRRHMLRRTIEHRILDPMFTMNEGLETTPDLLFHPRAIALDFDQAFATWLLDLREAREVSRDTILSQFDLSQAHEARMLEREKDEYDDIFQTINPNNQGQPGGGGAAGAPKPAATATPKEGGTPTRSDQRRAARKGGAAPGSGQGQAPRRPRKVSASEDEEGAIDDE